MNQAPTQSNLKFAPKELVAYLWRIVLRTIRRSEKLAGDHVTLKPWGTLNAGSLYATARPVSRLHLLLQQAQWMLARRSRHGAVFPGLGSCCTSDDCDAREARLHRARARTGPFHTAPASA